MELTLDNLNVHLSRTGLLPPGSTVVVGYSGGADSTALLHLLHLAGYDVIAAHLHHGMRVEADTELKLCEAFAQELGIPFVSGRADIPKMAADFGIGLEEAGRNARLEFLQRSALQLAADWIATGHTRDDQIETVLFHIARGSGLAGLAGIPEVRQNIVRPILPFSRAETRRYCDENGFWTHDDPSNTDLSFSRARIRHRVVPEMRLVHPGFDEAVVRLSQIAGEEDRFLNGAAAAALEQAERPVNGNLGFLTRDCEIILQTAMLRGFPEVLLRRGIRLVAEALGAQASFDQVALTIAGIANNGTGSVTLEGGDVTITWDPEVVHAQIIKPDEPYRFPLTVPGETLSEEFGWKFTVYSTPPSDFKREPRSLEVVLDAGAVKGSLYFRTLQAGDRMIPLGMSQEKLVADILSDQHITSAGRKRLPIVCDLVGPVWIPGCAMSERVKIRPESEKGMLLRFGPALDLHE
ncbi:MAG: tRNA lysidine(34) synthetase TilS [Armatimonadetes bacterium]|nr:tRNA lysidine(34) synthetase TilS [Armatimonadota bacterium]